MSVNVQHFHIADRGRINPKIMYYDIFNTILFFCRTGGFECAREYNKLSRTVPPNLREWCCQSSKWRTVTWHITYVTKYGFIPGIPSVWARNRRSHNYDNSESKLELFTTAFVIYYLVIPSENCTDLYSFGTSTWVYLNTCVVYI